MSKGNENGSTRKQVQSKFTELSPYEQAQIVRESGIFFIQHRGRPVRPTPELRPIINEVSRLSFLMEVGMRRAMSRRIPMTALQNLDEEKIKAECVDPVVNSLKSFCDDLEKDIFPENKKETKKTSPETESKAEDETAKASA